ncbi:hypothetical protein BJX63DRAFT_2676 [Aspergillus granulosus]|uniref:C2H2-type domain-containing protein n=1 Tax=Aspergillus granulosus TaxID=176169 RepID=A0ABR4I5P0_9EURO
MADEQFPWLEWPHGGNTLSNLPQGTARTQENSNPHWRSSLYNSSTTSTAQIPQLNNYSTQSQYDPTCQQQEKPYVRLEDAVPYPSYRWEPTRPTSHQPPTPIPQTQQVASSGESHIAGNMYSSNDAKRRRLDPPIISQAPSQAVPTPFSPVYAQNMARPTVQNTRPSTNFAYTSSSSVASRTTKSSTSHLTKQSSQPTGLLQQMAQSGSQCISPAASQSPAMRATQYAQRTQSNVILRTPSSASPQTAIQNPPDRQQQYPPNTTTQSLPQIVQPTLQSATRWVPQHILGTGSKSASHPVSGPTAQSSSQLPSSQPVSRPAAQSDTPLVPHHVQLTLLQQRSPSAQTAPLNAVLSGPPQTTPQITQALHIQPPPGPYGKLAAYSFQPENPADRSHLRHRMDIVSHLKEEDAMQRSAYDPKTIARDILIAAGRHPTEPNLNHHLHRLRDVFSAVDVSSDLSTFRWDLVDPVQPSRDHIPGPTQGPPMRQTNQTAPQPAVQIVPPLQVSVNLNKNSPPQQPFQQLQQHDPIPQQPIQQPQFPVQLQAPPLQPVPAAAPKTQGKVAALSPSTPESDMEKRRRGRPPGSANKSKVAVTPLAAPSVSYPVFACRWGNCQMELHNLDLLQKHLFKVHVSYSMVCGWKGCAFTRAIPAMELLKHVKESHLDSLAWKLGDGPAVPTSVDRDSGAKTVPLTIRESNHPGNEDALIFPASYSSIRAFNRVHGKNTQQEKAREIMKAVQRLKEHIGVGLDPGGCELATPLRNERVSNDEDIYEVRSE